MTRRFAKCWNERGFLVIEERIRHDNELYYLVTDKGRHAENTRHGRWWENRDKLDEDLKHQEIECLKKNRKKKNKKARKRVYTQKERILEDEDDPQRAIRILERALLKRHNVINRPTPPSKYNNTTTELQIKIREAYLSSMREEKRLRSIGGPGYYRVCAMVNHFRSKI